MIQRLLNSVTSLTSSCAWLTCRVTVSCTLKSVIGDVNIAALERPAVAGSASTRRLRVVATRFAILFGGGQRAGAPANLQNRRQFLSPATGSFPALHRVARAPETTPRSQRLRLDSSRFWHGTRCSCCAIATRWSPTRPASSSAWLSCTSSVVVRGDSWLRTQADGTFVRDAR